MTQKFEEYMNYEGDWNYHISDDYDFEYNVDGCILRTKDGSVTQYSGPSPEYLYDKIHPEYIKIENDFDVFCWMLILYGYTFVTQQNCKFEGNNEYKKIMQHHFLVYASNILTEKNSNNRIYINYEDT